MEGIYQYDIPWHVVDHRCRKRTVRDAIQLDVQPSTARQYRSCEPQVVTSQSQLVLTRFDAFLVK